MTAIYADWLTTYPIVSLEDPLARRTGTAGAS